LTISFKTANHLYDIYSDDNYETKSKIESN